MYEIHYKDRAFYIPENKIEEQDLPHPSASLRMPPLVDLVSDSTSSGCSPFSYNGRTGVLKLGGNADVNIDI